MSFSCRKRKITCQEICGNSTDLTSQIPVTPFGLALFSDHGIRAEYVQTLNPSLYLSNERLEEAGSSESLGLPDDPDYPADARSDPLAWTPIFRGNQNPVFDTQFDPYIFHGAGSESLGYVGGSWEAIEWDGVTTFPIWISSSSTVEEIQAHRAAWYDFVFPGDTLAGMRGLKQLYDATLPFKDPYHPTVHEWELWNDKVLNHFRMLSGLDPCYPSPELYIMCAFSRDRRTKPVFDEKYPGDWNSAYGPCFDPWATNIHCGTSFKPWDVEDQYPYWNEVFTKFPKCILPDPISMTQGSEAITVWYNGTAMTALSRNIRNLVRGCKDGAQIGGHGGPYCFRPLYGLAIGRSKWAGVGTQPPAGFTF